jgi:hypothetical protein
MCVLIDDVLLAVEASVLFDKLAEVQTTLVAILVYIFPEVGAVLVLVTCSLINVLSPLR